MHLEPWAEFRNVPALLPRTSQGVLSSGSVVCSGTVLSCSQALAEGRAARAASVLGIWSTAPADGVGRSLQQPQEQGMRTSNTERQHCRAPDLGVFVGSWRRNVKHLSLRALGQHMAMKAGGGEAGG